MVDRIREMIEARQAPGVVVRKGVRSGVMQDSSGRQVRVLYGGENQAEVERDIVEYAAGEGLDLNSSTLRLREEAGQGVGKAQTVGRRKAPRPTQDTIKQGTSRL